MRWLALGVALAACHSPEPEPWRVAPPSTALLEQAMADALVMAATEREARFIEATRPGSRAKRRDERLEQRTYESFVQVGDELFHLDTPWRGGIAPEVRPLDRAGEVVAKATRCHACHHAGGPAGSGTQADLTYFGGDGDDVTTAAPRLPPMLAGAALLELAARGREDLHPFGWRGDRPRRLGDMVAWSVATHLGVEADGDEIDALTVWLASVSPPRAVMPEAASLVGRVRVGAQGFEAMGCGTCHAPSLSVRDPVIVLANGRRLDLSRWLSADGQPPFTVHAYSDLQVHAMGPDLAEGGDDRWVTRPLWGVGSRPVLLHDGRATRLSDAVLAHGGEARAARDAYARLLAEGRHGEVDLFLQTLTRPAQVVVPR